MIELVKIRITIRNGETLSEVIRTDRTKVFNSVEEAVEFRQAIEKEMKKQHPKAEIEVALDTKSKEGIIIPQT